MHRTLPNILFILILFFLATAFPLSLDILSLDLSQKIVDKPVEEIQIEPELKTLLPSEDDSITNAFITFDIESNTGAFPNDFLSKYTLSIRQYGEIIKSVVLDSLPFETLDSTSNTKTIKIEKSTLLEGLNAGYYTCRLSVEDQNFENDWYISSVIYDKLLLKTKNQLGAKQLSLTVFYPTYDYKNVVPVTRHETSTTNRWRTLYSALFNGPKTGLGLYEGIPGVPRTPNIKISKDVASIYIYSKDLIGFEEKFPVVVDAVTRTFMSQGMLTGVKILVDDSTTNSTLGVDLTQTYNDSLFNSAFTGYSHASTQMLLMPLKLSMSTFDDRVKEAWEIMKHRGLKSLYTSDMIQSIPDEIQLLDYKLEGVNLTLNISKTLPATLENSPEYVDLMIKSILYTYASFPEVDTVSITTSGVPLITGLYDFTQPLKPDLYFNMEP